MTAQRQARAGFGVWFVVQIVRRDGFKETDRCSDFRLKVLQVDLGSGFRCGWS